MSIPDHPIAVPERVRELAGGASLAPVWDNDVGGLTFHTDDGRYIKYGPRGLETSMRSEAERLGWARQWVRVPEVLEQGSDDAFEWLVTRALFGDSAVAPQWIAQPAVAVRAIGEGLRALHQALPVARCTWSWQVPDRIANAVARGIEVPPGLRVAPTVDRLVVCHGDACAPNTLVDELGGWAGHVDFGALGVADRWADIAVAALSTEWNYGPGWQDALVEAYGLAPDRDRIAYYQKLWNAT